MPILSLQLMLNWPVTLSDRSASGKSIIQLIAAGERACQVRIWELSHVLRCFPSSLLFLESNSQSGFPGGASGKEPTCQRRRHKRHGFNPWVGKFPWRRTWQPTPVFLRGESHGQRNLAGYSPWGRKESDMTETASLRPHPTAVGLEFQDGSCCCFVC